MWVLDREKERKKKWERERERGRDIGQNNRRKGNTKGKVFYYWQFIDNRTVKYGAFIRVGRLDAICLSPFYAPCTTVGTVSYHIHNNTIQQRYDTRQHDTTTIRYDTIRRRSSTFLLHRKMKSRGGNVFVEENLWFHRAEPLFLLFLVNTFSSVWLGSVRGRRPVGRRTRHQRHINNQQQQQQQYYGTYR